MPAAMSQRVEPALPVGVEAAAGHVGDVERRRAEAPHAADPRHHGRRLPQEEAVVALADMGQPAADEGVRHVGRCAATRMRRLLR